MRRSLPEMNALKHENKLPFPVFAFHRGGSHEKAVKIVDGKDANGKDWLLDFVWSTPEFEKQLGGVKGLPSYYVVDKSGRVRAVIKGHPEDVIGTLRWLAEEIEKIG